MQEALIKILDNLDSFRGECHFTTWAQKICVRTAFAEMRRSRWSDVSVDEVISQPEGSTAADPQLDPERAATQTMIMEKCRRYIDEELTARQRTALLAALGGMPLEAVSRSYEHQPQRALQAPSRRPQEAEAEDVGRDALAARRVGRLW